MWIAVQARIQSDQPGHAGPWECVHGERANFAELVLGFIEADFCNQIFVGKLSPRSTQWTPLYISQISIGCQNVPIVSSIFQNQGPRFRWIENQALNCLMNFKHFFIGEMHFYRYLFGQ